MKKKADPNETYEVHEMMGCGEGHFWGPGFTHIESGEVCPLGHAEDATSDDVHLRYRRFLVPTLASDGKTRLWDVLNLPKNSGKLGQLPVAP